ncbi:hypothetical protein [Shimia abyssi]|uniref:Uncharacterized protein n=1 Tax=Shimia abyssi TaxID=1662395 RepID=A0A2P8F2U8_9RHOB|nr:hypothetical protein [Shimia abyssi]PSL16040.1 hypothetical protein CLV88_1237 [Shimia abyssi]
MKRLVGYDLNGWSDYSARNWLQVPGQVAIEGQEQTIHGGVGGVVVTVREIPNGDKFVGGMQALRAPHGRGAGWGDVGAEESRSPLLQLLESPNDHLGKISSALSAMGEARRATAVLSIPDIPAFGEDHQDALFKCLQTLRPSRRLLVWRPVLAVLAALDDCPDLPWEDIKDIGVVIHTSQGFSSQKLQLRKEKLFAPERRFPGRHHECDFGLETLLRQANDVLKEQSTTPRKTEHIETSQLPWKLALGHKSVAEPLRQWNGSWEVVSPPDKLALRDAAIPEALVEHLKGCQIILFQTPAVGLVSDSIAQKLAAQFSGDVHCLRPQAIAHGALKAAQRLSKNQPVYYDFLPQISTIVQDTEGAKNYDLIPPNALLPAGKPYRSSQPAQLGLLAGTKEIKVHLKKETDATPRRAVVTLATSPVANTPVELHLQQTPAAGSAQLTLVSEAFSGPLIVDWQKATELDQGWEELIESLKPEKPTVPKRLVLPVGMGTWLNQDNRPGLADILTQELSKMKPNWHALTAKLSSRTNGEFPISSDGEFPGELPQSVICQLGDAISLAEQDIRERLAGRGTINNQSLRFLTWLFHMCPEWIVPHLVDGAEAATGAHFFVKSGGSRGLMLQGIGRTARDPENQRRAFEHLLALPMKRWKKDQIACASFLLSRTDTAPMLLERNEVEFLAEVAEAKVLEAVGREFTSAYIYGPFLLVGLIRWRLRDPWALVVGRDPIADRLLAATRKLMAHLSRDVRQNRYHLVLEQVCEELEGQGSNPDILIDINNMI